MNLKILLVHERIKIAKVISKYCEPTDEEKIKTDKDNWKEEFIKQLKRNEEREKYKIIKTIEIIKD